jgi:hypothetical protein
MSNNRPLNKSEQRLFARLYVASLLHHDIRHKIPVSDKEEQGIEAALVSIIDSLTKDHPSFASTGKIVEYIKGLRR